MLEIGDKEGDKISHSDQILRLTGNGNIDSGGRDLKNGTTLCIRVCHFGVIFPNHSASGRDLSASH